MQEHRFPEVWYRDSTSNWSQLLAMQDRGTLEIRGPEIEFRGAKNSFTIHAVSAASIGRQGRDFVNQWVRVEYAVEDGPRIAYFADGALLGWGGIFGGTKRLFTAIQQACAIARIQASSRRA